MARDFKGSRPTYLGTNLALATELGASAPIPITDYQELLGTVPSALTGVGDSYDADVGNVVDVALTCNVLSAGTGDLRAQYSSDGGANWNYLGTGSGPSVSLSTTGQKDSGWVSIASAAQSAGAVLVRLASINGTDNQNIEVVDAVVRVRDSHAFTNLGATGLMNQVEVNLGTVPRRAGHFDIVTTGLTVGQNVIVEQINGPYTGKGTQADEAEMDQITVSGQAISSTVIRCYWNSPTHVRGNFKFGFTLVGTLNTVPSATDAVQGVALANLMQLSRNEVALTTDTSLDSTSFEKVHYLSAATAKNLTLPPSPGSVRRVLGLRVSPSSAGSWYVGPYASETIDGAASAVYRPGEAAILEWSGSDWVTIAERQKRMPAVVAGATWNTSPSPGAGQLGVFLTIAISIAVPDLGVPPAGYAWRVRLEGVTRLTASPAGGTVLFSYDQVWICGGTTWPGATTTFAWNFLGTPNAAGSSTTFQMYGYFTIAGTYTLVAGAHTAQPVLVAA